MFEGPPGHSVQRKEPYILPQTSNFPLAGAVRLCRPHSVWMPGKTDGPRCPPRHGRHAGSLPEHRKHPSARGGTGWPPPDPGDLVPSAGIVLAGKVSPPFVQINWGRAKRSRVKFGPGGFQSSGLLLLSHFIIMNNKEILTHGFCKLFIARTEKSGQQYVKQTTCMSALT